MKDGILNALQLKMADLTTSQRKVADYILKNPVESAFLTLDQLAGAVGTSTTTVMRLAFTLSYSGFTEFQKALQDLFRSTISPATRLEANIKNLDSSRLLVKCAEQQAVNIEETIDFLSDDMVSGCLKLIMSARKVYVVGMRTSFGAAYYLYQGLNQIMGNCELLQPGSGHQVEQVMDITDEDLVIVVCLPRYARSVVELVKSVKLLRAAKVVSITDGYASPLAAVSDLVLPCAFNSLAFHNSIAGAVLIADFLITAVAMQDPEKTKERLDRAEDVFQNIHFHVH